MKRTGILGHLDEKYDDWCRMLWERGVAARSDLTQCAFTSGFYEGHQYGKWHRFFFAFLIGLAVGICAGSYIVREAGQTEHVMEVELNESD